MEWILQLEHTQISGRTIRISGIRLYDLRHFASALRAESGAADSTSVAIAARVGHKMLERCKARHL